MEINFKNSIIESWKKQNRIESNSGNPFLHKVSDNAIQAFDSLDFPNQKHEAWRFSNPVFLQKHDFNLPSKPLKYDISEELINQLVLKQVDTHVVVLVNGHFSPELSKIQPKKKSIFIGSFADAVNRYSDEFNEYFTKLAKYENDAFIALNTAFSRDGLFINVPDGTSIEKPVHIINLTDSSEGNIVSFPRKLIIAGECVHFKILESNYAIGDNYSFTNSVNEIILSFSSQVDYYKIQNNGDKSYYISNAQVKQEKMSALNATTVSLKGKYIRNNLNTLLNASACETSLSGLYYLDKDDFVDNHTVIDHAQPNCISHENYKGILDDKAHAVFNGKIIVRPDAQKTSSYQSNKNILLTDTAKINTKPELEIYADDVKCSHGATSGYLDKDSLFYLQARGISETMAKSLLLNAFAGEVLEKIGISELRDEIKRQIVQRLIVDDLYFCDVLEKIPD
ncbi:MAG: Fe-S cluster assembly protein SufD [Bacteroidota bacterium]